MDLDLNKKLPLRKKRLFIEIFDARSHIIIQNLLKSIELRLDIPLDNLDERRIKLIKEDILQLIDISRSHIKLIVNFFED